MNSKNFIGTSISTEAVRLQDINQISPTYKVCLYNNDYTSKEFVVEELQLLFLMNEQQANITMLNARDNSSCNTYESNIAKSEVQTVNDYVRESHYLLLGECERL